MTTKPIPDPILKEWEEDLDEFTKQVTKDLPEWKTDSIRSVIHLAGSLIKEVFLLRKQSRSQRTIHLSLHRQILKLEKMVKEVGDEPKTTSREAPGSGVFTITATAQKD